MEGGEDQRDQELKNERMKENISKPVSKFLSENRQTLEKGEEVFYFSDKIKPNTSNWINWSLFILIPICILGFLGTIHIMLSASIGIAIIFFFAFIASYLSPNQFHLITSNGIRIKKGLIPWSTVQKISFYGSSDSRQLVFQLLDSFDSGNEVDSIILPGTYNAIQLHQQILPFWESKAPIKKLSELSEKLATKYKISSEKTRKANSVLSGDYRQLELYLEFNNSFPFKQVKTMIVLPDELNFFLHLATRNQVRNFKDLQIGDPEFDARYKFDCSQIALVQQLLADSRKEQFSKLHELGTVIYSFGKLSKRISLKTMQSSSNETEEILDADLTKANHLDSHSPKPEKTLKFNGILHPEFKNDPQKTIEFVELGMELSVLLAEGIKEL